MDGNADVEIVVLVVVGIDVVGHGLDCISTLQDELQYATKHHPKPSVTLYTKSPGRCEVPLTMQTHAVVVVSKETVETTVVLIGRAVVALVG